MGWAKIDDLLPHHPKTVQAGRMAPAVLGVYVASICYAQRHLTDGIIPRSALKLLIPSAPSLPRRLIVTLVKVGLWEPHPHGWKVHDYLDHNPSAATRRQARKADAERHRIRRERPDGQSADVRAESGGTPPSRPFGIRRESARNPFASPNPNPNPLPSEERSSPSEGTPTEEPAGFFLSRIGPEKLASMDVDPPPQRVLNPTEVDRYLAAVKARTARREHGEDEHGG